MGENLNSFVSGFVPFSSDDKTPKYFFLFFAITTRSGDNCEGGDVKRGFKTAISSKIYRHEERGRHSFMSAFLCSTFQQVCDLESCLL